MPRGLKLYLMPWKRDTRIGQATGFLCLIVLVLSITMFFTNALIRVQFVALVVFLVLIIINTYQDWRELKRIGDDIKVLGQAMAIAVGDVDLADLPPDVQEEIKIEMANLHLNPPERS